jgi:endonuclease YncB( thermonuclease family)
MRPAALITALAGTAIVFGLIAAGGQRLGGAMKATEPAPATETGAVETAAAAPSTTDPAASMNARPVDDASQFYPAAVDGKPLERIAAPEPQKPKAEGDAEKGIGLPRPVADSAGILGFGDRRLQLAGITPTSPDKICTEADGTGWPCGMLAKTNFRLFLRLRTVECNLDSADWKGVAVASCKIGTQDVSRWLVENGWAEAAGGSALVDAGAKARQERKGIYGGDPRKSAPLDTKDEPQQDGAADPL